jgi:iron-sulfur cluster repair protein YtfE (RIC family)
MKKLWNWICSIFTSEKIGIIWRALFTAAKNTVAEMVSDPANQQKAWDIAKSLMSSGKTNDERLAEFNAQMKEWAKEAGKQLTNKLTAFTAWLGEHIKLEDEILFPRAIAAEGMPTIE